MRHSLFINKILSLAFNILRHKEKSKTLSKADKNKAKDTNNDLEERNPNIYGAEEAFVACVLQEKELHQHADIIFEKTHILQSQNIEQLCIIRSIIKDNKESYPKAVTKTFLDELEKHLRGNSPDLELVETLKNVLVSSNALIKSSLG